MTDTVPSALIATARQLAADFAERAEAHDRDGSYPAENIDAIWAAGLANPNLPVGRGGHGADLTTTGAIVETLAAADPSTALIYVMHVAHLEELIAPGSLWPAPLVERVVADCLARPALINALRVEPELGSPSRGGTPATRARRGRGVAGEDVWRITGRKTYATGSYGLRWMIVGAATSDSESPDSESPDSESPDSRADLDAGSEGERVGTWLVPGDAPGVEVLETWDHLGMRASASHDVVFHDVEVPFDHAVGLRPAGGKPAEGSEWTNALILRVYLGVAKAARDWLVAYLNQRTPSSLGAPLATLPRFQAAMGEIEALIFTADALAERLGAGLDAGGEDAARAARESPLTKAVVTGNVVKALEVAMALIGNPGLSYHHPLQRHYRNALCSRIHTPQDDAVYNAAGRTLLGR